MPGLYDSLTNSINPITLTGDVDIVIIYGINFIHKMAPYVKNALA